MAVVVYGAGMLQGFAFTLVPALATVFTAAPYHAGARAFGALFVPLTLGAILGASITAAIARRRSVLGALRLGIVANAIALLALMVSRLAGPFAYDLLLIDTAALGMGFGLNFSAVNELASLLPPNETVAVTLANVCTGLGTSLTPILIAGFVSVGLWELWPALLLVAFIAVLVLSSRCTVPARTRMAAPARRVSFVLVLFATAALLYGFCEGTFSSWATTFVHLDRRFSLGAGEAALTGFWLALTAGRLAIAPLYRRLTPSFAYVTFPLLIALAFVALPLWQIPAELVMGFILGGLACSIVFPYAISLSLDALPADADRVAGVMVAALMSGEGVGTFVVGILRDDAGLPLVAIYRGAAAVAFALSIVAMLSRSASRVSAANSRA